MARRDGARTGRADARAPAHVGYQRWRRLLRAAGMSVLLGLPVAALAFAVRAESSALHRLDVRAVIAATDVAQERPAIHTTLVVWQEVTQPGWLVLAGSGMCLWVARRHGMRSPAVWGVVTMLAAWGISSALKLLVQRARPVVDDPLAHAGGFSFPSGHATGAAVVGAVLAVVLWPLLGSRGRVVVPVAAAVVALVTSVDRVALGVHHPSDVVAGLVLGGAVTAGSWLGWTRGTRRSARTEEVLGCGSVAGPFQ